MKYRKRWNHTPAIAVMVKNMLTARCAVDIKKWTVKGAVEPAKKCVSAVTEKVKSMWGAAFPGKGHAIGVMEDRETMIVQNAAEPAVILRMNISQNGRLAATVSVQEELIAKNVTAQEK